MRVNNQPETYITTRQVAERLQLAPKTVMKMARLGHIPSYTVPGTKYKKRYLWTEIVQSMDKKHFR